MLHRLAEPGPYLQVGEKVRALVVEALVRGIGRLAPLGRTVARILQRQRAGDDQDLRQALVLPPGQQQACDPRVERQAREFFPQRGELARIIDRAEFGQ